MSYASLLQHTCAVYSPINTIGTSGGTNIQWTLRTGSVPCLIRGLSGSEQLVFAQRNIVVTHAIYLSDGSAQTGDKVIDAATGKNFLLESIQIQEGVGTIDTFYFWLGRELLPGR